jgi:hypothetical protein
MLIRRDDATATRPFLPDGTLNRQSSDTSQAPPSTFAQEGWAPIGDQNTSATIQDRDVQPTSSETEAPPRSERSLLVPQH